MTTTWRKRLQSHPHMLFLWSESGFISTELFEYIMDDLAKWRRPVFLGYHSFLTCNSVSIHSTSTIVRKTWEQGINVFFIVPGSSHWFQLYDQQPFTHLKKMISREKNETIPSSSTQSKCRRKIFVVLFCHAEINVLQ